MATDLSIGLVLALLTTVEPPRPLTINELRRRATQSGIRSIDGRSVKFARKEQLLRALDLELQP
jgi:hypothetical protein